MGEFFLSFGFSSIRAIRITLNFNREREFFPPSVISKVVLLFALFQDTLYIKTSIKSEARTNF